MPACLQQQYLFADYFDRTQEFIRMHTSIKVFEFGVATDDYLLDFQAMGPVSLGIASDLGKNFVVEVDFARAAFDDDFTATV
jgi:hypothetical protein